MYNHQHIGLGTNAKRLVPVFRFAVTVENGQSVLIFKPDRRVCELNPMLLEVAPLLDWVPDVMRPSHRMHVQCTCQTRSRTPVLSNIRVNPRLTAVRRSGSAVALLSSVGFNVLFGFDIGRLRT